MNYPIEVFIYWLLIIGMPAFLCYIGTRRVKCSLGTPTDPKLKAIIDGNKMLINAAGLSIFLISISILAYIVPAPATNTITNNKDVTVITR